MKYSIVYSSKTGNTKMLAEKIKEILPKEDCISFGDEKEYKDGPLLFIGFWTDKGTCNDSFVPFLKSLKNKKIFLFGTAGFGGGDPYYNKILERVKENLDSSNEIIGSYMCQGKMPMGIRKRYEKILEEHPEDQKSKASIENFDKAAIHPNEEDLDHLIEEVKKV
ncbi:MAG: flavodoxin family protein, partial [Tissierellia bacterium]|nr:flavodoxin family protein [Tissierellia bacterium]